MQNETTSNNPVPPGFKWTTSIPSVFYYVGELFLDSYPFQKALAVTTYNKKLRIVAYVGFIPLVLAKSGTIVFRYVFPFIADFETFNKWFNLIDGYTILISAWSDVLNCIVIVYIGSKTMKLVGDAFLVNLVKTTELRIVASTVLTVTASALIINGGCINDPLTTCKFSLARNVAVEISYSLYYLDYLVLKFYKFMSIAYPDSSPMTMWQRSDLTPHASVSLRQTTFELKPNTESNFVKGNNNFGSGSGQRSGSEFDKQENELLRFIVQFDILAFLVVYIDGFSWKKRVPATLFLHWLIRSLGASTFGITLYVLQNQVNPNDPNETPGFKWTTALPSVGYYIGELFLDSYPFQKALAVTAHSKRLRLIPYVGFVPLVLAKLAMMVFRYVYPFMSTYEKFNELFNV
ncbi:hypothetical protein HK096_003462 [Nowakowskiella sp. JEL0078]|nr:hypothetical protein HK096_003462 [Nowakowskiella sp. JEL0078]